MKSDAGSLVFTSSSVGRQGRANWGAYATSKFATEGMMQVLADEYQNRSLRVNCINPGGTRTSMRASAFPTEDPQKLKRLPILCRFTCGLWATTVAVKPV